MKIPYDVLYHIYFMIDDYPTLLNFNVLDKTFYYNYIRRYNKSYKHRFSVLFKDVFSFLSLLPNLKPRDDDIQIFMCIQSMCIEPVLKPLISNDIIFMYRLYKSAIFEESTVKLGINLAADLTNMILIQGPNHIDRNSQIIFNKNKVKIILPKDNRILELSVALNFLYLRRQFQMFDNFNQLLN
jgi:hypothetical protein